MSLSNKAKDPLATGANKAKQAAGKAANNAKDKAIENTKNAAINGADKATGGTISKLQQAYKVAKRVALVIKKAIEMIAYTLKALLVILSNPVTWWIALAGVLVLLLISALNVFGGIEFRYQSDNTELALENLTDESQRNEAVGPYLAKKGVSHNVAGYLAQIYEENKGNLVYSSVSLSDCNNDCILKKIESGENIQLGVWKLSGANAKKLIETANSMSVSWNTSEAQIATMAQIMSGVGEFSGDSDKADEEMEKSIREVNSKLGISMTDSQVKGKAGDIGDKVDAIKDYKKKVKALGMGNCVGRIEGGTASGEDCGEDDGESTSGLSHGDFAHICDVPYFVVQPYGATPWSMSRRDMYPFGEHTGVDIQCEGANTLDKKVYAVTDGEIRSAGPDFLVGTCPLSRYAMHYKDSSTGGYIYYGHMYTLDSKIKVGAKIKKGQFIGFMGHCYDYHTHLEWNSTESFGGFNGQRTYKDPSFLIRSGGTLKAGERFDPKKKNP